MTAERTDLAVLVIVPGHGSEWLTNAYYDGLRSERIRASCAGAWDGGPITSPARMTFSVGRPASPSPSSRCQRRRHDPQPDRRGGVRRRRLGLGRRGDSGAGARKIGLDTVHAACIVMA